MLKAFIEKIETMATTEKFNIGDREYTSQKIYPVKEPTAEAMKAHTLTALVDYLKSNPDKLEKDKILVRVQTPKKVMVCSSLTDQFLERSYYLTAETPTDPFDFGRMMDLEQFIINIQAQFVPTDTVADILKIVGNLTEGVAKNHSDDGVTQEVTIKAGIKIKENVALPNPVILAPFRTFPEIDQPVSNFIFRIKTQRERAPLCGLFEADGAAWKNDAIAGIKEWLEEHLPEGITILA